MGKKYKNIIKLGVKNEVWIITFGIVLYVIAASLVSLHRFWQYNAFWYDFGIFDETIWKLSKFQLPLIPNLNAPIGKIVWADHFNPSALLLAPLYWLTNKPEIILIAQAVFIGWSGFVAYLTSKKLVQSVWVRFALIFSYLGFVGMQNALFTDVHNIVFAVLPLQIMIWALFNEKWKYYWLFLILTLGFQENMAGIGIGIGMFLIFSKRNKTVGIQSIIFSIIWALTITKFIVPLFNHAPYNYAPDFPEYWSQWLTDFVMPHDMKLKTIIFTILSFGGLSLVSISAWPLIIEQFLERFVLNSAATRWDLGMHYNAILSPIMFLATLNVILKLQQKKTCNKLLLYWGILTIITVVFLHRFYLHGPLLMATDPIFYRQTKNNQFIDDFFKNIPKNGLIMTQNNLAAHLTHEQVVLLNTNIDKIKPDVVAIDIHPGQNANDFYPLSEEKTKLLVIELSRHPSFIKYQFATDQYIFRRKN